MLYLSSTAILAYVVATGLIAGISIGIHAPTTVFTNNAQSLKAPPNSLSIRYKTPIAEFIDKCTPSTTAENSKVTYTLNADSEQQSSSEEPSATSSLSPTVILT